MNACWTSGGRPVASRGATAILRPVSDPQLHKLDQLINAATAARLDASRGDLFVSAAGKALVNAMHDLTEVKGLYDLAEDIGWLIAKEDA